MTNLQRHTFFVVEDPINELLQELNTLESTTDKASAINPSASNTAGTQTMKDLLSAIKEITHESLYETQAVPRTK